MGTATDPEGCEYKDLAAAEQAALRSVRVLLSYDLTRTGELVLDHLIEITDPAGALLLVVPFEAGVKIRQKTSG